MKKKVSVRKFNQQFLSKTEFRPLSPQASFSSSQILSIWTPQLKALFDQKERTQINKLIFNLLQLREEEEQRSKLLKKSLQQTQYIIKKYEKERRALVQTNNELLEQVRECEQLRSKNVQLQLEHSRALKNIQIIASFIKRKQNFNLEDLLVQHNPFHQDLKKIIITLQHDSPRHAALQTDLFLQHQATLTENDYLKDCEMADDIIEELVGKAEVRAIGKAIQDGDFKISRTAHKIKLLYHNYSQLKSKLASAQQRNSVSVRELQLANQKNSDLALKLRASQMANSSNKEIIGQLEKRLKSTNKHEKKNQKLKSQISQQLTHLDKQLSLDVFGSKQSEISNEVNRLVGQKLNYINYIYQKKVETLENSLNQANDQIQELINANKLSESVNAVLSQEARERQRRLMRALERGGEQGTEESELLKGQELKLKGDQRQY